ncbi:MAG: cytidine deaminase [Coprobacillus sp.]|nr:cytidine deaminase [Coprobacillus sp.]MCI9094427.1 cytidine deaminase [Coprobacillus sp.]
MDIWEKLYLEARKQFHPEEINPFIYAHHVVCALESENGDIFTGFCIESCCGVMDLCAERVAALNMYINSGQTVIKKLIVFRDVPPFENSDDIPCGACREFLMQLDIKNKDMEIMIDYKQRKTTTLETLSPHWWGTYRYQKSR